MAINGKVSEFPALFYITDKNLYFYPVTFLVPVVSLGVNN